MLLNRYSFLCIVLNFISIFKHFKKIFEILSTGAQLVRERLRNSVDQLGKGHGSHLTAVSTGFLVP